jgi:hypothetical protein
MQRPRLHAQQSLLLCDFADLHGGAFLLLGLGRALLS